MKSGENYPCGPCPNELPFKCSECGIELTLDNVIDDPCEHDCEICAYCYSYKCPDCGDHICCGGCI